ncbi:AF4/FMR2 family member lilli [Anopheles aquasalis]|uniref:AF4/FMR2 family member lilli n=1 Tax=Anopheles aquasalis TaxID=42839 RepID=UPI00215B2B29|nr:AF4/FMR2 family member lilli [Anopheles aquasalis]
MRKLSLSTGTGMSRPSKAVPQMKKVMPPAVPEIYGKERNLNGVGCVGTGDTGDRDPVAEILPAAVAGSDLTVIDGGPALGARNVSQQAGAGTGTTSIPNSVGHGHGGRHGTSDGSITTPTPAATATPSSLVLRCTSDASGVLDYALDDQGIDLTQSPGRDSPVSLSGSAGSGSRHSTASLDSGRASSYLTGASNLSNRSVSGVGSYGVLSSPRCSVSSCSIGSGSGGGSGSSSGAGGGGSHRLSNHSNRCDHDIISEWLMEVHFHEYTYLFLDAGYDLATIARMTPEDLTAIGIRKPNHRERLKRHIDALKLPDSLPSFVPGSIEEWLRLLRLEEYVQPLLAQGYQTVHDVTQLTWEDLEDIGIVKLGHQKKILLAIKRVKDIISGKMMQQQQQLPYYALAASGGGSPTSTTAAIATRAPPPLPGTVGVRCAHYTDDTGIGLRSDSALGLPGHQQHIPSASATTGGVVCGNYSTFLRQHQHQQQPPIARGPEDDSGSEVVYYAQQQQHHHLAQRSNAPRQQQLQQMITYPHVHFDGTQAVYRRSSFDDSDITPTNDDLSHAIIPHHHHQHQHHHLHHDQQQQQQQNWLHSQHQQQQQQQQYFQGGGTLPRQYQRGSYGTRLAFLGPCATAGVPGGPVAPPQGRQRPIAKIVANNLKLPGTVAAPTDTAVADSASSSASPSALCFPAGATGLPASLLGHIENVEMATAALDAMHFSNYSSAAAAYTTAAQSPQQLLKYGMKPGVVGSSQIEPNAAISQLISGSGGEASQQQQQQQQPIYHNQLILQQSSGHGGNNYHHLGPQQQQQQQHGFTSSTQSTPSPPNQHHHPLGGGSIPFVGSCFTACHTHQTTVEVHKVSTQQHDNKSNSSLESIDQIPFANENAGTIKQRSSLNRPSDYHHHHQQQQQQQQHHHHHHPALLVTLSSSSASSSSSSSASTGSITTTATTSGVLQKQQQSSPSSSSSIAESIASPNSFSNDQTSSSTVLTVAAGSTGGGTSAKDEHRQSEVAGSGQELTVATGGDGDIYGTNVLNDIGHMLANLTDELDAMLEDEKCAGISDAD